ncbi:c2h2 finger domain containing protein [Grosmannia clavigera kw1407]|uniref:C2h2 finger domain containing protein n=1 Tax=Grosmannia clavigera (strain kw1407 / UAMH 11150) TaxID=655863 RepID=F0XBV6_GROCL|nr:c2h2 finger domain containing protein [Grosmannia clavigera kw1407]EFX04837.1 c2h2 finger domain containing protein [Grosmannia clavigera kw1407]
MAPRFQTLRPAQTASAREAMRSFFCDLCQKGYSRMNEYEAHLSSYDHSHKQRLKDMKAMVRDPAAADRARRQEAKATDAVISIKLSADGGTVGGSLDGSGSGGSSTALGNSGAGFKKGGFRKGGFKSAFATTGDPAPAAAQVSPTAQPLPTATLAPALATEGPGSLLESDTEDEGYEPYDPWKPTD